MSSADQRYTIAASALRGLIAYARARGIPTSKIEHTLGLSTDMLRCPEARVTQGVYNSVWEQLAIASGDPSFGLHFAERVDLDSLDVLGHLVARSPTFGSALERMVTYSRVLHDAGGIEVEKQGNQVAVFPGCRGLTHGWPSQVAEFSAAAVVVIGRRCTNVHWSPVSVSFRHRPPSDLREHLRIFGVTPAFSRPETAVVIDATVLSLPMLDSQPGLVVYLDAYARDVIAKLPNDDSLPTQVSRAVANSLEQGVVDIESIAKRFGLSARTLQRRLDEHRTTFQAIVDNVRLTYAERYLSAERLSLQQIAFLLGFSEPSNFNRAFRRWTGMTPNAFRKAHCQKTAQE